MLDLVKKLREIAPIYFSLGNHEIEYEKRTGIDLTEKLEKAGAKVLEEKFVDVTVKGQKFRIGGLYTVYIPEDYEVHEWDNAKEQAEFLKEMEDTERYKILLSHIPNTWMYYDTAATFDLDLIFTGHAHGGQASIELQTSDSTTGMTSTIEGSYDIGMASRELKEEEAAELEPTVIATDGIAVVVNNANPLDELSADQVKDIYVGNVSTWDEITK